MPTASHSYFESLQANPNLAVAYSLRDQGQLDQYVHGPRPSRDITYDPAHDGYRLAQDAAKVVVGRNASTIQQVRLPVNSGAGRTLITWDAWWGSEFRTDRGAMATQKTFQIASPRSNAELYLEIRALFARATPPNICSIDMRAYGPLGPNVSDGEPVSPQLATFQVVPNTWTRFWVQVDIKPDAFDLVSLWVADEARQPVQLLDGREIDSAGSLTDFWLEYNSSQTRSGGPLVGYVRNVAVLRNVTDTASLLQRP
jgi:hypothetical protein